MLGSHGKSAGYSNSSGIGKDSGDSRANNCNHDSNINSSTSTSSNPRSVSARLSTGMMPYFIPPPPPSARDQRGACHESGDALDLMTPPMSPTEHSFGFGSTIEGRLAASSSSSTLHPYDLPYPPNDLQLPHQVEIATVPGLGSLASPTTTGSHSTAGSISGISPRPVSFHWDHYREFEDDDDDDDDDEEHGHHDCRGWSSSSTEEREDSARYNQSTKSKSSYHRQFEGHHSLARRSSFGGQAQEEKYDSLRHGIGLNVSDVSEELAKARLKMNRASRAMKSMEQELEAMQLSIDESKASSATARSAIEENYWRLECLALTLEKDRQDTHKQLQAVGRECTEASSRLIEAGGAVGSVTNWEVRIDWLERRVDNTSEYVSELVLSEQECMSFIKMIIQQNRRYAMPAISRATERNIRLMAPPKLKEISHPSNPVNGEPQVPVPRLQSHPQPVAQPQPQPSPRLANIPISWLLDPIMPPKPPEIHGAERAHDEGEPSKTGSAKKSTVEPPAEFWRDFSRLTSAFETGQARTPFTPFQRSRSRSTGPGSSSGFTSPSGSSVNSGCGSGGVTTNSNSSLFKTPITRRPQVENMSPMPKILPPAVAAHKVPAVKRRSQAHLPVHSWLQFQFSKTMATPGPRGQTGGKKQSNNTGFKPITIFQATV
ncbi:hypothetical protein EC968_009303 [Mortierella alpina]|nr:hypothetical protein EC968_009303 [Mortierella alpina]